MKKKKGESAAEKIRRLEKTVAEQLEMLYKADELLQLAERRYKFMSKRAKAWKLLYKLNTGSNENS